MAFNNSSCHYQEGLRVLYDGSKHFWRTRTNIDVVVALHTNHNCIEIVCFNATLGLKAPRIYLNFSMLKSHLDYVDINEQVEQMKEEALRSKRQFAVKDATAKVVRELALNYIFARLDFAPNCTQTNFQMKLCPLPGDHKVTINGNPTLNCVMPCPTLLIPVTVDHKAKLSTEEVDRFLNQLNLQSLELHQATKFADLVINSTDGFRTALTEQNKKILKSNIARQRWRKACHRIIVMNYVQKAKERILCSHVAGWYQKHLVLQRAEEEASAVAAAANATETSNIEAKSRAVKMSYSRSAHAEQERNYYFRTATNKVKVVNVLSRIKKNHNSEQDDCCDGNYAQDDSSINTDMKEEEEEDEQMIDVHGVKLPPIQIPKTNKKLFLEYPSEVSLMERERARHYRSPCHRRKIMTNYHKDIERDPYFVRENERRRELGKTRDSQSRGSQNNMCSVFKVAAESPHSHKPSLPGLSLLEDFNKSIGKLDQNVRLEAFADSKASSPSHHRHHHYHKHHTQHITPEQYEEMRLAHERHNHGHRPDEHQRHHHQQRMNSDAKISEEGKH